MLEYALVLQHATFIAPKTYSINAVISELHTLGSATHFPCYAYGKIKHHKCDMNVNKSKKKKGY